MPLKLSDKRGFSLLELLIAVVVVLSLLSTVGLGLVKAYNIKWKNETSNKLQKLVNAYKAHYLELRQAAAAYDQSVFYWNNKSITPLVVNASDVNSPAVVGSNMRVYSSGRSQFYEAGCAPVVSSNNDYAELACRDSYDIPLRIEALSQRPVRVAGSFDDLRSPYFQPSIPVEVSFISAGPDKLFDTEDDIKAFFSSSDLDNYYMAQTEAKLRNILQAIKEYHNQRIYSETIQLTYENSLSSYDDIKVPWVWQLYSSSGYDPKSQCVINSVSVCRPIHSCLCPYQSGQWPALTYSAWDSTHIVSSQLVMVNLGLIPSAGEFSMVRDDFGMVFVIDLISGAPGAPPIPADNYSWSVSPPFITTLKTPWGKQMSIVHVN